MAALFTYVTKSAQQVTADFLRTVKNGLIRLVGIPNPNVGPNSDYAVLATALGNEIAVIQANGIIQADNNLPDTAAGAFLDRWLTLFGRSRNPAIGSFGVVTITTSVASTSISVGAQLTDSSGLRYQVTVGGNYGPTTFGIPPVPTGLSPVVPIQAIDTGEATNHSNGDTLTWVSAPFATQTNVTVGTLGGSDGLEGGADSEVGQDEAPRARLLALLRNPPLSGNWSDVVQWCLKSSPDVQAAFIYPALLGAGTVFFVVIGAAQAGGALSANSKNRDLPASLLNGTIIPYVQGKYPEHAIVVGATAVNSPTSVALLLSLPSAPAASPPGPGGGWVDGTPWPSTPDGVSPCVVLNAIASNQFIVNAVASPIVGVSSIAWISPLTWTLFTAKVSSFTGTPGEWQITVDTPMPGIANGNYIFPQSTQQQNYLAAILQAFANLGVGEWVPSGAVQLRGLRRPLASLSFPNALDANFLRVMEDAGPEVETASFIFRSQSSAPVPGLPTVGPQPFPLNSAAPQIMVPANLGWYAK